MSSPNSTSSPRGVIAGLWAIAVALLLYGAEDVRGYIVGSPWLSERPFALRLGDGLVAASERLGLPALRETLSGWLALPADRYVVLKEPARPKPPDRVVHVDKQPDAPSPSGEATQAATPTRRIRSVLLIGASSIQHQPGIELERLFGTFYEGVNIVRVGKVATGLARPDVFDWPKRAKELVDEHDPDLVIANFGGNDAQGMMRGKEVLKYGTPEWDEEYASRLRSLIEASQSRGALVAIIGMPIMRSAQSSERVKHVNAITKQAAEEAGATYISMWEIAADEQGNYREAIEHRGKRGPMRQSDGWHFTRIGGEYVAEKLIEVFERHYWLEPADRELATAMPRALDSRALGRKARYVAYVPRGEGSECFPALFLLHGAFGSWEDWPSHAHRELQRLAQRHRIVIVTPDGSEGGWYVDSPLIADSQYATHIAKEVVEDATASLPITSTRSIGGLSMGGHGAITLALKNPGLFVAASSMSGVLDLPAAHSRKALIERLGPYSENRERWEQNSALHLIEASPDQAKKLPMLLTVGSSDHWAATNRQIHARLTALGIEHDFDESEGGHDWKYWTEQLPRHVEWHAAKLHAAGGGECAAVTARR